MTTPTPPPDINANVTTDSDSFPTSGTDIAQPGKKRKVLWVIVVTIILGAVGSGLWDMIVKPGVSSFGRLTLSTITFGSNTLRDSAYQTAALDPTPLPALVILTVSVGATTYIIFRFSLFLLIHAFSTKPKKKKSMKDFRTRTGRVSIALLVILNVLFGFAIVVSLLILNQAVLIHRVFSANLTICSPYLTTTEQQQFKARFVSIKTRTDYLKLDNDLRTVAAKNGVSLSDISLW